MSRVVNIAAAGNVGPFGGIGAGAKVRSITVNKGVAAAVFTIYDGQSAATGVVKGAIDASANRQIIYSGCAWFANGFFGVLSGANADVTVEYD